MSNDSLFNLEDCANPKGFKKHISSKDVQVAYSLAKQLISHDFLKLNQLVDDPSIWESLFHLQASMPTILFLVKQKNCKAAGETKPPLRVLSVLHHKEIASSSQKESPSPRQLLLGRGNNYIHFYGKSLLHGKPQTCR